MSWLRDASALTLALSASLLGACKGDPECDCQCDSPGVGGVGNLGGEGGSGPRQVTADKWGLITFISYQFGLDKYMRVSFQDTPVMLDPGCQVSTLGTCEVRHCPSTEPPVVEVRPHAGPIQVISQQLTGMALAQPDANGDYGTVNINGITDGQDPIFFFPGGEQLTFIAEGATVPSFDVSTNYPSPLNVIDPPGVEGVITASASQGLTLTLAGGDENDELFVYGTEDYADGTESTLICTFPTAAGAATLTPEIVASVPTGFELTVRRMQRELIQAGEYEVTLRLLGEVGDATDANAVSIVTALAPDQPGTGGVAGTGGIPATGGTPGTGGDPGIGTGGVPATGGTPSTGGDPGIGTGGVPNP